MKSIFIYRPLSGDRVFAEKFCADIKTTLLDNGSRTVMGGTHLVYNTSVPKQWWRNDATTIAKAIVECVGGIAWDNQGMINIITPIEWGYKVFELLNAAQQVCSFGREGGEKVHNEIRLLLSGFELKKNDYYHNLEIGCSLLPDKKEDETHPQFIPANEWIEGEEDPTVLHELPDYNEEKKTDSNEISLFEESDESKETTDVSDNTSVNPNDMLD